MSAGMHVTVINFTGFRKNPGCRATSWELLKFLNCAFPPNAISTFDLIPLLPVGKIDQELDERYSKRLADIIIASKDAPIASADAAFVEYVCRQRYDGWMEAVARADFVVFQAEGTMAGTDYIRALRLLLLPFFSAAILKKKTIATNQTIYNCNKSFTPILKAVYSRMAYIGVREPASVAYASAIRMENVRLMGDTAFMTVPDPVSRGSGLIPRKAFFVLTGTAFLGEGTFESLVEVAYKLQQEHHLYMVIATSTDADKKLLRTIENQSIDLDYSVVPETASYRNLAYFFARAKFVIGGRYHMAVLAATVGTPIIVTQGNTYKNEGLAALLNWEYGVYTKSQMKRIVGDSIEILKYEQVLRDKLSKQVELTLESIAREGKEVERAVEGRGERPRQAYPQGAAVTLQTQIFELVDEYSEATWKLARTRQYPAQGDDLISNAERGQIATCIVEREQSRDPSDQLVARQLANSITREISGARKASLETKECD